MPGAVSQPHVELALLPATLTTYDRTSGTYTLAIKSTKSWAGTSKSRRQGLVVCRVTLPFEGFCNARPGVTLAPTFFGVAACQSRIICW